jgi:coenzyme F420 hydrogenase subunit beta
MRLPVVRNIDDVVQRQLCCGCGACAAVSPERIEMIDTLEHGRRPTYKSDLPANALDDAAMGVCPGVGLKHSFDRSDPRFIRKLLPGWGPVLEVWEGFASDEAIRFAGSSGGAATALALACIEAGGMSGALHVSARPDAPYLNHTVLSRTRDELLRAAGSRYAPASPCDGLSMIEREQRPCVFIGKPCDVAAARMVAEVRPELKKRLGVTIAIFCAGTPTTRATLELLRRLGVDDPSDVVDLRYRGNGWPGETTVTARTEMGYSTKRLSYSEAWGGILTHDKQWRCHVCADHTGELADIAVGDPWHRAAEPGESGRSLVLVRTERGQRIVREAMASGYIHLSESDPGVLPASQPNLLRGRGAVWGRIAACRLLGVAAPHYRGFPMFRFWCSRLTLREKIRSVAGTFRRILNRRLRTPVTIERLAPALRPPTDSREEVGRSETRTTRRPGRAAA